jgi:hypothetical protein
MLFLVRTLLRQMSEHREWRTNRQRAVRATEATDGGPPGGARACVHVRLIQST